MVAARLFNWEGSAACARERDTEFGAWSQRNPDIAL
jgi:hypothetical protein